ncbi:MAG: hypothetical protein GY702_25185 [Desulfobulbaceae bacterium]|nr:hypothetical protein [Desulfobulbaceae bacterium]
MVSKQETDIDLSKLKQLGTFPVRLQGELYTAPFSQKSCVWFEWIHSSERLQPDRGYSFGYGTGYESSITVKSTVGDLVFYPYRIMLYLAPSFNDIAVVDGKEKYIWEFCLEPDQRYYAFTEKFTYHLPPFRFFPFIPRRKTTWLLALSDKHFDNDRPLHPLIPTRQGRTG